MDGNLPQRSNRTTRENTMQLYKELKTKEDMENLEGYIAEAVPRSEHLQNITRHKNKDIHVIKLQLQNLQHTVNLDKNNYNSCNITKRINGANEQNLGRKVENNKTIQNNLNSITHNNLYYRYARMEEA